jgi:hypothetical protein
MALNKDKIDGALALLYLTLHDDCRAWKDLIGMCWIVCTKRA